MATLKLVILDCDGVMFSSKEANRHYYNDLLKAFSCPPMTQAELIAASANHLVAIERKQAEQQQALA